MHNRPLAFFACPASSHWEQCSIPSQASPRRQLCNQGSCLHSKQDTCSNGWTQYWKILRRSHSNKRGKRLFSRFTNKLIVLIQTMDLTRQNSNRRQDPHHCCVSMGDYSRRGFYYSQVGGQLQVLVLLAAHQWTCSITKGIIIIHTRLNCDIIQ